MRPYNRRHRESYDCGNHLYEYLSGRHATPQLRHAAPQPGLIRRQWDNVHLGWLAGRVLLEDLLGRVQKGADDQANDE